MAQIRAVSSGVEIWLVGSRHDAQITGYAAVASSRLVGALELWERLLPEGERLEDFSFVDLGCGKGRAVLLASERGFREVVGVELNPELTRTAEANVTLWKERGRQRSPTRIVCGDATEIAYPRGPLLLFLFNPFGAAVMKEVLDAVERHVRSAGARVDLIYQNESPETVLRSDPRLCPLWTGTLAMSAEDAATDPVASPEDVTGLYRWMP